MKQKQTNSKTKKKNENIFFKDLYPTSVTHALILL